MSTSLPRKKIKPRIIPMKMARMKNSIQKGKTKWTQTVVNTFSFIILSYLLHQVSGYPLFLYAAYNFRMFLCFLFFWKKILYVMGKGWVPRTEDGISVPVCYLCDVHTEINFMSFWAVRTASNGAIDFCGQILVQTVVVIRTLHQ